MTVQARSRVRTFRSDNRRLAYEGERLAAVYFEWLLIPLGYLIGSFPSARLIGAVVGHDPTAEGSGNPGATNMFRIAGLRAGGATLVFDVCKALGATLLGTVVGDPTLGVACGAASVVGHIFPFVRSGRGGKGVACFGGLAIGAWPVLAVIGFVAWAGAAKLSHKSFVGAFVGTPIIAIGTAVIGRPTIETVIASLLAVLIIARHHKNVRSFLDQRGAQQS